MNCHSVSPLMSSALYQAGIRFNPSVPQPVLLGKFYFGCPGGGYGPSKTTLKNHVLGNMCLHTPGVSASWKNRAYSSYWLDALSLFKNKVAIQVFKFAPRPVVAFQVNLDWHLLCRALWCTSEKDGAFFSVRLVGPFIGNPSLLSKRCFSVSYLHIPKLHEKIQHCIPLTFSIEKYM